ncbi:metabolite traffic protein EboE, partial [Pseudomonadota bacterium]
IKANIQQGFASVKETRKLDKMASGLWLSAKAAAQLQSPAELADFKQLLQDVGVCLTSLNGFPYGDFHQQQVKQRVYLPDWSSSERLAYSRNLAAILAACLPEDITHGAISSLPLGYQANWDNNKQQQAIKQLLDLNLYLGELEQKTGKRILLCLEMEPDCVLESTHQLIQFFDELTQVNKGSLEYIGVCFDVCHQAVMHEDVYHSLNRIYHANIPIGKIQISNAISVDVEQLKQADSPLRRLLWQYAEAKYLHQVKAQNRHGDVVAWPDLSLALEQIEADVSYLDQLTSWRIHFHVPLNCAALNHSALTTHQHDLRRVFDFLAEFDASLDASHDVLKPWLEVETYSWNVLPEVLQPQTESALVDGIAAELNWLEQQLRQQGLMS